MTDRTEATAGRDASLIRVDSLREVYAWIDAYPHASGPWEIVAETRSSRDDGATLAVDVQAPDGDRLTLRFDTARFGASGGQRRLGTEPTLALDELMATVTEYAAQNPPHHPGELPRFPVPSLRYPGRLELPLAILAADDDGRPGLYAPARMVVVSAEDGTPYGVGEMPGFDPDRWPPARLGDWPPVAVGRLSRSRLAGIVARFNALWLRVLAASGTVAAYPQLPAERAEARSLLGQLEVDGMDAVYRSINEPFWDGLRQR